jgi:hypothetical protein
MNGGRKPLLMEEFKDEKTDRQSGRLLLARKATED